MKKTVLIILLVFVSISLVVTSSGCSIFPKQEKEKMTMDDFLSAERPD